MNKSFTLIEILVVIVVIGILSAFVLVGMNSITNNANIAKSQTFLNSLDNSLLLSRVSYWKLDEGSGTAVNDLWGENDCVLGTSPASPAWTNNNCVSGSCLYFDGGDNVNCGTGATLDTVDTFTISGWIRLNVLNRSHYIYSKGYSYANLHGIDLRIYSDNQFIAHAGNGTIITTISTTNTYAQINTWYNVVSVYSPGGYKIYVNGIKKEGESVNPAKPIVFEADKTSYLGVNTSGYLDEIKVYKEALSASDINCNYFIGLNKLFQNKGIALIEFNQRLGEIKSNLSQTGF